MEKIGLVALCVSSLGVFFWGFVVGRHYERRIWNEECQEVAQNYVLVHKCHYE